MPRFSKGPEYPQQFWREAQLEKHTTRCSRWQLRGRWRHRSLRQVHGLEAGLVTCAHLAWNSPAKSAGWRKQSLLWNFFKDVFYGDDLFCLYMCLWTVSTCLVSSVQERVPDRLELVSWEVVSCRVGGGNLTLVLCESKCLPLELSPQPSSLSE